MNDGTFKVGEIGILQNLSGWPGIYNGEEAEIVGNLQERPVRYVNGGFGVSETYLISFQGQEVGVRPSNLRKKRPPAKEMASPRELEAA